MRDTTLTITIGRNIKNEPMSDSAWAKFASEIEKLISHNDAVNHVSRAVAVGLWLGIPEDNFTWVVGVEPEHVPDYLRDIDFIRKGYSQDAIAVTVGSTILVGQDSAEHIAEVLG